MRTIKDLAQGKVSVSATKLSDLAKRPSVISASGHSATDRTNETNTAPAQSARIRRGNDAHDRYERDAGFYMTPAQLANDMMEQSVIDKLQHSNRFPKVCLMAAVGMSLLVLAAAAFF